MKKPIATTKLPVLLFTSTLLLLSGGLAAQTATEAQPHQHETQDNSGVDHSKMDHSKMQQDEMPMDHNQMDHSKMQHDEKPMDHSSMDHGDMQMQGGKAPADARDPHAYSSGYTLTDGPYGMADSRHLKHAVEHPMWSIVGDRLEYDIDTDAVVFDMQAWYGTTYDKLVVKSEGHVSEGILEESQTDLLWGHAVAAYWDRQLGVRFDQNAEGESRQWLAFGIQGLAPYWFELDITAYVGSNGRTALAAEAEYEVLLTQRLVLQARAELAAYGKDDAVNAIGKGLTSSNVGLRMRYEFSRQLAPYAGIEWSNKYGNTADLARLYDEATEETALVAGLRFWF